jgi:L-rhamnose isomerase/sugar isomerase
MDAYESDVRSMLADRREELGLPRDPMLALRESGYRERIVAERVGGAPAGWN